MSFTSTSEYVADPVPPMVSKDLEHLPWNFFPYRDMSTADSSRWSRFQVRPKFRPQCFSHSRRFAPRGALRAYFIPLPRVGFTLQGFSLLPSRCFSSKRLALLTFPGIRLSSTEVKDAGSYRFAFKALVQAAIRDHRQRG